MRPLFLICMLVCVWQNNLFAQQATMIGLEVGKPLVFPASTKGTFFEVQAKQKVFKNAYLQGALAWGNHYPVYGQANGRYLLEPVNITNYQTQGFAFRTGLMTVLKSPIWRKRTFLMLGGQVFYGNTSETIDFTIKDSYFGDKTYQITHKNMSAFGIGGLCMWFYKLSPSFSLSLEGSLSMLSNPARRLAQPNNIQVYPFYLKGAGVILNPRANGILFGANTGLKLFYMFSKKS